MGDEDKIMYWICDLEKHRILAVDVTAVADGEEVAPNLILTHVPGPNEIAILEDGPKDLLGTWGIKTTKWLDPDATNGWFKDHLLVVSGGFPYHWKTGNLGNSREELDIKEKD